MRDELSPIRFLDRVLDREIERKRERRIATSLKLSGLPTTKTLENFHWTFQPRADRTKLAALGTCAYLRQRENVLFRGPPGVGKSHLAAADAHRSAATMDLSIFCADIGSVARGKFAWSGELSAGRQVEGSDPGGVVTAVSGALGDGGKVALGFECPLFAPVPSDARHLGSARRGEDNRPWSAAAGAAALAIGLAEVASILRALRQQQPHQKAYLSWEQFLAASGGLFLGEALVSAGAKLGSHLLDVGAAVRAFRQRVASGLPSSDVSCEDAYSLAGAALLRTGRSSEIRLLESPTLVIRADGAV